MEMFVIRGGKPLEGRATVSGAKNAALPLMAAALLTEEPLRLHNVPDLVDVRTMAELLRTLGVKVLRGTAADGAPGGNSLLLQTETETPHVAHYELVRRMRAGVSVLGPLLARRKRACVSLPGGCNIGVRPIDLHLKGLRALGAELYIQHGYVVAEAQRLRGARIYLAGPLGSTVTGTCNVMSAAVLAEGTTVIEGAACEPEVVDLGHCLNRMGARIGGLGTPCLTIEGVDRLQGTEHTVIPDRIEAATLMTAAAITGGTIRLNQVVPEHLTAVLEVLRQTGTTIECLPAETRGNGESAGSLRGTSCWPAVMVRGPARPQAAEVVALPYPGVPTDVQAQLMALLSRAEGISAVTDRVFPDRFMHAAELARMGARIRREASTALIAGVEQLTGACVMASDLRASAALVLAALAAEGDSVVRRIYHLDRGYEALERKLAGLGAAVSRVEDRPENMPSAWATPILPAAHFPAESVRPFRRAS